MQINLFNVLLSFLAFGKCYGDVTWRADNCNGFTFNGVSINKIWDNAVLMASNAQSAITSVPTNTFQVVKGNADNKRAGGNAQIMWGPKYSGKTGADSTLKANLQTVNSAYGDALMGLAKTLTGAGGFNLNNAILFCGNGGFQYGVVPGSSIFDEVWYYEIQTGAAPNQVTEYFIPLYTVGATRDNPPCMEDNKDYVAMTSMAAQTVNGVSTDFVSIMLCPNRLAGWAATLNYPFTTASDNPDTSRSMAGAILHEMAHVVGISRGQDWSDKTNPLDPNEVGNYGFVKCAALAIKNAINTYTNPDNYRIFAEMSMSPATEWRAPPPPPPTG